MILRAEQSRAENIDVLKAICAFLIVCLHIPFPGQFGAYFTVLTRIAVPIFFMITGYYYSETIKRHKEKKQIWKIFRLGIEANVLYFLWNITLNIVHRNSVFTYIQSTFTKKNLIKFFVLNESVVAGHLWYLGAVLYVLIIIFFIDKLNLKCRKILYWMIPILLVMNLIFGTYALVVFRREFPLILVRNFLCVGIPYFCIGILIREEKIGVNVNKKVLCLITILFAAMGLCEKFILENIGMNATEDHYISTIFLAITVFIFALKSNWKNKYLADIGRTYSTWLYIIHPIFITILTFISEKFGIYSLYYVASVVVYVSSLIFLVLIKKMRKNL